MVNALTAGLVNVLASSGGSNRLSVLIFHRVLASPDYMRPGEPSAAQFSRQMSILKRHFKPLSLCEALDRLDSNALPAKSICVTFDDGYADNEALALPILKKFEIPASIFVTTKYMNGGVMWNDRVIEGVREYAGDELDLGHHGLGIFSLRNEDECLCAAQSIIASIKHLDPGEREVIAMEIFSNCSNQSPSLMLDTCQLRSLSKAGVEIGGHTHSHPILSTLSEDSSRDEIALGKSELEQKIDKQVRYFAYPNGRPGIDYNDTHVQLVKSLGFQAALSTHWGASDKNTDRFQLPRFTPWDRSSSRYAVRLALNYRNVRQ